MNFKNLATRFQHAGLYSVIALMATACQSDKAKLNALNSEIDSLENRIKNTYVHDAAVDSASRNPALKELNAVIDAAVPHINKLYERNWELSDSINNIKIRRIAKKYPLTSFLSSGALKTIQAQLRRNCSYIHEKSAQNIIDGRGTLFDLYTVSFDLYFDSQVHPFHIVDPLGTVRFNDERRNKLCNKFDKEMLTINTGQIINKEYESNQNDIQEFEYLCKVRDSIQSEIESFYQSQKNHRIDSLKQVLGDKYCKKEKLMHKMRTR